jgi:GGDEF domain-containing protein
MRADGEYAELMDATSDSIRWAFLAGVELLKASRATLLLREGDDKIMRVIASIGMDADVVPIVRVPFGEGIAGLAAERNMVLCGEANGSRYITVPVVRAGSVIGVINLTGRVAAEDFDDDDVLLARSLADHIAHLLTLSLSHLDYETGLLTPTAFVQAINREVERGRRTSSAFTLVLIRIGLAPNSSRFLSSVRGGDLLRRLGEALQAECRGYDLVSRYEDTTFGVLFPAADELREARLGMLLEAAGKVLSPIEPSPTVTVGQVHYPDDGATSRELLAQVVRRCDALPAHDGAAPLRSSDAGA